MRKIISALSALTVIAFPAVANADSYLCIADQTAGFHYNEAQEKWVSQIFTTDNKYVIKPHDAEGYAYRVDEFGKEYEQLPLASCESEFSEQDFLFCLHGQVAFRMNIKNQRFVLTKYISYLAVGILENRTDESAGDPYMQIGKCSEI